MELPEVTDAALNPATQCFRQMLLLNQSLPTSYLVFLHGYLLTTPLNSWQDLHTQSRWAKQILHKVKCNKFKQEIIQLIKTTRFTGYIIRHRGSFNSEWMQFPSLWRNQRWESSWDSTYINKEQEKEPCNWAGGKKRGRGLTYCSP